jgi:hypothetical protein
MIDPHPHSSLGTLTPIGSQNSKGTGSLELFL